MNIQDMATAELQQTAIMGKVMGSIFDTFNNTPAARWITSPEVTAWVEECKRIDREAELEDMQ